MKNKYLKSFNDPKVNKWEEEHGINIMGVDHIDPHEWIEIRGGTKMCKKCRIIEEFYEKFYPW